MSAEADPGRWWENYLVRYFMPSIAGTGIVAWLVNVNPSIRPILFFGAAPTSIDAPTLTLLVLYGNLFCYIASFPILCFHVTRAIDFRNSAWLHKLNDGYIVSAVLTILIGVAVAFFSGTASLLAVFALVMFYGLMQGFRFRSIFRELKPSMIPDGGSSESLAYAYSYFVAIRRNIRPSHESVGERKREWIPNSGSSSSEGGARKEDERWWRKEFTDTYRHMREHGNSAFIFVLEFTLAMSAYCILRNSPFAATDSLAILGALLLVWSLPAVLVHLTAQSLEHRFSLFDARLRANGERMKATNQSDELSSTN